MNTKDINNSKKEDQFMKEWFHSFEPATPKDEFTKQTMNKVMEKWVSETQKPKINYWSYVLWTTIGAALVYLFLFVDLSTLEKMDHEYTQSIPTTIKSITSSLSYFKQIPSIVYLIALGGFILYWIDKQFSRKLTHF